MCGGGAQYLAQCLKPPDVLIGAQQLTEVGMAEGVQHQPAVGQYVSGTQLQEGRCE